MTAPHEGEDLAALLEPLRVKYKLPALAGAIVSDEKIEALGVTGFRKDGDRAPALVTDAFHLGSDTKALTAVVIAKAVEAGKITWTTTIGQAFVGVPMDPAYANVTLEDLLAMRAGFPHDPKGISIRELRALTGPMRDQRDVYVKKALLDAPDVPPKTKTSYSNVSYVVAAVMVERATGVAWEDAIRTQVFEPLGMTGAGFGAMGTPGKIDAPWQHLAKPDGLTPIEPGPNADNPLAMAPAGCVHVPIAGWAYFLRDQLRGAAGKGALLKPETYKYLQSAHSPEGYFAGWQGLDRSWGKGRVFTHTGSNTVSFALVWMAPGIRRAFLVMTNQADPGDATFQAGDAVVSELLKWASSKGEP